MDIIGNKEEREGGRNENGNEGLTEGKYLIPYIKTYAKQIMNLNVKCKTIKLFKNRKMFSGPRTRKRVLRLETKNAIYKRKN